MKPVIAWTLAGLVLGLIGCSPSGSETTSEKPNSATPPVIAMDNLDRPQAILLQEARQRVVDTPTSGEAWGRLGQHLHAVDYQREAITCYQQAAELDAVSPRWPYLLGMLELQNDPESGLFHLRRAVQLADVVPDAPRLHLAKALVERGEIEEARQHLNRLLSQTPDHPAARLEQARLSLLDGNLEAAAREVSPCLTNAHTARPGLMLLAQVRQRQGQNDVAANYANRAASMPRPFDWPDPYLRQVLRLRVDRQKFTDHINSLLMGGRLAEAEAGLQQLLGAFPDDAEGLLLQGRLRFLERKCDEAETALRRHLTVQPESLNGLVQLALAQLCQQRWNDAATVLRQAIALKPDFAEAHYNLGHALARDGDSAGARRSFEEALRCRPGYVDAHVALAEELLRAQESAKANFHLQRALVLDPQNKKAQLLLRP